jgi:hypothetical protein
LGVTANISPASGNLPAVGRFLSLSLFFRQLRVFSDLFVSLFGRKLGPVSLTLPNPATPRVNARTLTAKSPIRP